MSGSSPPLSRWAPSCRSSPSPSSTSPSSSSACELHTPLNGIQWVTTGYLLGIGAVIPVSAGRPASARAHLPRLAQLFRRRVAAVRLRLVGAVADRASASSRASPAACPAARPDDPRRAPRARSAWPRDERRSASRWSSARCSAPRSAACFEHAGWHWIFVINVPFGIAALFAAGACCPRRRRSRPAASTSPACAARHRPPRLIYGLSRTASPAACLRRRCCPATAGIAARRRLRRPRAADRHPLLDVGLLRNRALRRRRSTLAAPAPRCSARWS